MIRNWPLSWYVLFGIFAWGIPAVFVLGPLAIELTLLTALPIVLLCWRDRANLIAANHASSISPREVSIDTSLVLVVGTIVYLIFDASFGQKLIASNIFLSSQAVEKVVDQFSNDVGVEGRGFAGLLAGILQFMPFILADMARRSRPGMRIPMLIVAAIYALYTMQTSRAYIAMAGFAIFVGSPRLNFWKLALIGICMLGLFQLASFVRGDFLVQAYSNPLFDGVIFPYLNLAMLGEANCGTGTAMAFLGQFFQKFLPGFLFHKEIFAFNTEMTRCIYPSDTGEITAVSVYTYLGEFLYYQPGRLVAFLAGLVAALEIRLANAMLNPLHLSSTRIYTGLICINFLRSRTQDLYSLLLFLIILGVLISMPQIIRYFSVGKASSRPQLAPVSE